MRVGLTGGIAQGKSTVLGFLADLGVPTASADSIARNLRQDPSVREEIRAGLDLPEITNEGLRALISSSPEARQTLNAILHPRIIAKISSMDHGAVEVPLLFEACIPHLFDEIWAVTCEPEEQERRLTERLGGTEQARSMIALQLPSRAKAAMADRVIRTDPPIAAVQRVTVSHAHDSGLVLRPGLAMDEQDRL